MYVLRSDNVTPDVIYYKKGFCMLMTEVDTTLWHKRLCRINKQYIKRLTNWDMVRDFSLKNPTFTFCEACTLRKLSRFTFDTNHVSNVTQPLELIHIDLCCTMPKPSIGGSRYLMVMVDQFSKRIFSTFLKTKDQAYDEFFTFVKQRVNETGKNVKRLRTDNGGEFTNSHLQTKE